MGPGLSEVGLGDLGKGGGFMSRSGIYPFPYRSPPLGNLSVWCQVTRLQAGRVFQGAAAREPPGGPGNRVLCTLKSEWLRAAKSHGSEVIRTQVMH